MKLELAIVQDCSSEGCQVQLLNGDFLDVSVPPQLQSRLHIRPQQLIALNTEVTPPQFVWRWHRVRVQEIQNERIIGMMGEVKQVNLVLNEALPVQLAAGDEVWTIGTSEEAMEVHEQVLDGLPAHPARLLSYIQPMIEAKFKG